jgi:uncharacterized protein (TIGR00290 family)
MKKKKVSISWSGGKDSAFALYKVLLNSEFEVVNLHTVFNTESRRVGMHGVHEELIAAQAEAIGIPLEKLYLDASESHEAYMSLMREYYRKLHARGIEAVVFGDIFLEDLKSFRDGMLHESNLNGIYPLWQIGTRALIEDFLNLGFKTIVCAANGSILQQDVVGKTIDRGFIFNLPERVDVCGENGEFHTFVYQGPIFNQSIKVQAGQVVTRDYEYKTIDEVGSVREIRVPFFFSELKIS